MGRELQRKFWGNRSCQVLQKAACLGSEFLLVIDSSHLLPPSFARQCYPWAIYLMETMLFHWFAAGLRLLRLVKMHFPSSSLSLRCLLPWIQWYAAESCVGKPVKARPGSFLQRHRLSLPTSSGSSFDALGQRSKLLPMSQFVYPRGPTYFLRQLQECLWPWLCRLIGSSCLRSWRTFGLFCQTPRSAHPPVGKTSM